MPRPEPVASTPIIERRHRVHTFAGRAHDAIDDLLGGDGAAFCSVAELSPLKTRATTPAAWYAGAVRAPIGQSSTCWSKRRCSTTSP